VPAASSEPIGVTTRTTGGRVRGQLPVKGSDQPVADPEAFARDANAESWVFLCGEEFAAMDVGMSYAQVQAAVPQSTNIIADPPRPRGASLRD